MSYETILLETHGRVGLITLNRPQALNALNAQLVSEVNRALDGFEADANIGCIVITGSTKAFAAGADIKEMADLTYPQIYMDDLFSDSDRVANRRKPIIAAVNGFALGGGCELALMCDFILAGDNAKFGQPEINLGVLPGMGGTQRLTRAVGKAKAMDMALTGRMMDAAEAQRAGLVSRVVALDKLMNQSQGLVIGRSADQCELVVPHATVSRRHARLSLAGEALQVEDLGSTNGTAINGTVLRAGTPAAIHAGNKLRIGDVELLVRQL